jgi:hypothetical protein
MVSQAPQFGFELAGIAGDAGWVGVVDTDHSRVLVFCSDACLNKAKTKRGTIRLRPVKN